MTMGTASTMTSAVEALGVTLPGAASIPAADSRHAVMAAHTGRRIVDMVWEDVKLSTSCTRTAFRNAITTVLAHRRLDERDHPSDRDGPAASGWSWGWTTSRSCARRTPLLANIRPSGEYLMEDFFYAGGLPALLTNLGDLLDTSAIDGERQDAGREHRRAKVFDDDVIRTRDNPMVASDTLAVLFGNLAPDGAVIKPPAAEPRLHSPLRPGRRVRELRRHGRADRRPRPRGRRELGAGAAERRSAGRAGHARMGPAADPQEAARDRVCATWCASPTRG